MWSDNKKYGERCTVWKETIPTGSGTDSRVETGENPYLTFGRDCPLENKVSSVTESGADGETGSSISVICLISSSLYCFKMSGWKS